MRVALYLRVSSRKSKKKKDSEEQAQDVENQRIELAKLLSKMREYCKGHEELQLTKEYVDNNSAKGSRDNQQFVKLFQDAKNKKFDAVLFWALDRFDRAGTYSTLTKLYELKSYGVDFISYTEQYLNSLGEWKDAIIGILAAIARQEVLRMSERTKAGLQKALAQGKTLGRPRVEVDAQQIALMRVQGKSWPAIARELHIGQGTAVRAYQSLTKIPPEAVQVQGPILNSLQGPHPTLGDLSTIAR